jgi:hypothetical protein
VQINSSSAAGTKYAVNFSAAGASVEAGIDGTLTASSMQASRISALATLSAAYVTVAADGAIDIVGVITTGVNTGNLTIQHAKVTSGTSTIYINSYLNIYKIA